MQQYYSQLYKGKGNTPDRSNYRDIKLLIQVMKIMKQVMEYLIRKSIALDVIQLGTKPVRSTTDTCFLIKQVEKYLIKICSWYLSLRRKVPHSVTLWALRKLGLYEWLVQTIQVMYKSPINKVWKLARRAATNIMYR